MTLVHRFFKSFEAALLLSSIVINFSWPFSACCARLRLSRLVKAIPFALQLLPARSPACNVGFGWLFFCCYHLAQKVSSNLNAFDRNPLTASNCRASATYLCLVCRCIYRRYLHPFFMLSLGLLLLCYDFRLKIHIALPVCV